MIRKDRKNVFLHHKQKISPDPGLRRGDAVRIVLFLRVE
jgi:hypothetical protein